MPRLSSDPAGRVARLFDGFPHKRPHLAAVLDGSQPGVLFLSDPAEPLAGAVRHCAGHVLLTGDPASRSVWAFLEAELEHRDDPSRPLMLVPADQAWERAITERLGNQVKPIRRVLMLRDDGRKLSSLARPDGDVSDLTTVDPAGLHPSVATGLRRVWGSIEAFRARGVGFQVTRGDQAISICFAVTVGAGAAPIQINTTDAHKRQGFAQVVAQHYIERCGELSMVPHWECDETNAASFQLARKLGFREQLAYTHYHYH